MFRTRFLPFRKLLDFQQYFPVGIDALYPAVSYFVFRYNRSPKPDGTMYPVVLFYIFYRQYDKKFDLIVYLQHSVSSETRPAIAYVYNSTSP